MELTAWRAGNQICLVSGYILASKASEEGTAGSEVSVGAASIARKSTLAGLVWTEAGPQPEWHPKVLTALLARGRFKAASAALRELLRMSEQVSWSRQTVRLL